MLLCRSRNEFDLISYLDTMKIVYSVQHITKT